MLAELLNLSTSWSSHFPSLQNLPDFLETDLTANMHLDLTPPSTLGELIQLQQHLTRLFLKRQPRSERLLSGDFQTKIELARSIVEQLWTTFLDKSTLTIGDPTCGTGTFLLASVLCLQDHLPTRLHNLVLVGIDRQQTSLSIAWFCLSIAKDLLNWNGTISIHLELGDILDLASSLPLKLDIVLGNPPWITWTDLPDEDKRKWRVLETEKEYSFIQVKGMDRAMGGINVDIGPHLFMVALHQLASKGAIYAFLFKPDHLNSPSLVFYRQGKVPHTEVRSLQLTKLLQSRSNRNFHDLQMATDCYIGRMDRSPTSSLKSVQIDHIPQESSFKTLIRQVIESTSDVLYLPSDMSLPFRTTESQPEIRHGIKHDCREVFEIDEATAIQLGWQCVYPTVKSRHVSISDGWTGEYSLVLVPNQSLHGVNESQFADDFPLAYRYLESHREKLLERKSQWVKQGAFYTIFGIGDYSFSTYKVAWVRLGWKPRFVLLSPVTLPNGETRPVVPSDHFLFIPTESMSYAKEVVSLLNSAPYQKALAILSTKKKSSLPKKLVSKLHIPIL